LIATTLSIAFFTQQSKSNAGGITYLVEHKFETTSTFGVGPTNPDTMHTWSRCKRTSPSPGLANVYVKILGEVIFYDTSGQELDLNGNILNDPSNRTRKEFPDGGGEWTISGTPAVIEQTISWNTATYLNGPAGAVKKIIRRYSLYSRGTANTQPVDNPTPIQSVHLVNQ
jgi:hypothetical protein